MYDRLHSCLDADMIPLTHIMYDRLHSCLDADMIPLTHICMTAYIPVLMRT
jgi:hypothetical protein